MEDKAGQLKPQEGYDTDKYKDMILSAYPEMEITSCHPILQGWDSFVLEVNGEYIFRFPSREPVINQIKREISAMPELAKALPIPVPEFTHVHDGGGMDLFVGYRKIEGIPLASDGEKYFVHMDSLTTQMADFLTSLHYFPLDLAKSLGMAGSGSPDDWRKSWLLHRETAEQAAYPYLDAQLRTALDNLFLHFIDNKENFKFKPAVSHHDLCPADHILCNEDKSQIVGVIDWGDAMIGDPALDFCGLLEDCGKGFAMETAEKYGRKIDSQFWERADFYIRVGPYFEIWYGHETGNRQHIEDGVKYLKKALKI